MRRSLQRALEIAQENGQDVVGTKHRRWHDSGGRLTYIEGTQFMSDSGMRIINWPAQQNANGIAKHQRTGRRYKKLVRILKNLRNEMNDAGIAAAAPIPSFLSECLIWNVPDDDFDTVDFVTALKLALLHLTVETASDERCNEWGEESELKPRPVLRRHEGGPALPLSQHQDHRRLRRLARGEQPQVALQRATRAGRANRSTHSSWPPGAMWGSLTDAVEPADLHRHGPRGPYLATALARWRKGSQGVW
jgi:hypothetical protein